MTRRLGTMANCIVLPMTRCHENVIAIASLYAVGREAVEDNGSDTRRLIPDSSMVCSTLRERYLQATAISERTAPVVEVTMYVRVTQHDGNLHPHSAASSVVDRQDAKMELQPVLHVL
jgi:hypothetical protein